MLSLIDALIGLVRFPSHKCEESMVREHELPSIQQNQKHSASWAVGSWSVSQCETCPEFLMIGFKVQVLQYLTHGTAHTAAKVHFGVQPCNFLVNG